jgi:PTH2 family peptidyl-tRNA hydrolase
MADDVKQVIVIRKDLKMRRGKEIAQGAHASIAFLTRRLQRIVQPSPDFAPKPVATGLVYLTDAQWKWAEGRFTKICLQVNSEQELLDVKAKADVAGVECNLITDAGLTEFGGVPTNTCLAIGPDYADRIDAVTGHLTLY